MKLQVQEIGDSGLIWKIGKKMYHMLNSRKLSVTMTKWNYTGS